MFWNRRRVGAAFYGPIFFIGPDLDGPDFGVSLYVLIIQKRHIKKTFYQYVD